MILLDHLAVSGRSLAEARAHVEAALGVAMQPGGAHEVFHTHNALLGLEDGLYLEAIAVNPDARTPARPRWFDLDRFDGPPRLTNWICRTDNLEETLAGLPDGMGAPVQLQRGDLRWRMAVPASGILPFDNRAPALMSWQTQTHPAERLTPSGVRLRRLTVMHPDAADLAAALDGCLQDDRIAFEAGPSGLSAAFDSPHGRRVIEG
jgi:hypothetical protein